MNEKLTDENPYELEKIRDLINRVQQSIIEVETQITKIEWLRLYFALYFLNKSKSINHFNKALIDHRASGIDENRDEV